MPIHTDAHGWILESAQQAYAFGLDTRGQLVQRYWGPKLPQVSDYPPPPPARGWASFNDAGQRSPDEYPAYGGESKYIEPCLMATFADGVRDVWLTYARAIRVEEANIITIRLDDAHYPLRVYLTYRLHEDLNLIERYVEIQNHGDTPITLQRVLSAAWHLPLSSDYALTHFTGRWFDEWQLQRNLLPQGVLKLDSKRGTSSHHHHPAVLLSRPDTTDTHGDCWFASLEYSGNWQLLAERTNFDTTRLSMGLNDWDFAQRLDAGLAFTTPSVFLGWTGAGLEGASHRLHALARAKVPHPQHTRWVLYNSWEATLFDVDETSQKQYAAIAAGLGVELFVMDDGWFHGRRDDTAGLGDWWPDETKFPHGLTPLIDYVNGLGMQFGLWVEPEMVNPDSDLYRAHPDWVLHFPTRPRTEARHQLVLNMARRDVQDHLIEALSRLLRENRIAFIKWDMNRNLTEAGWDTDRDPREVWGRYVEGLERVWQTLRERFPAVIWQSCSGGGGRADLGILRLADQVWISDNTEPNRRIPMQENYLHLYPPNTLEAWVTDMGAPDLSLTYRFHVSMCGNLGIGANITRWTEAQKDEATALIAQYKQLRPIIQQGQVYRHAPDARGGYHALQFVSADQQEAVLFVFRVYGPEPAYPYQVCLRGLLTDTVYTADGFDSRSGGGWQHIPMTFELQPFESRLIHLRAANPKAESSHV